VSIRARSPRHREGCLGTRSIGRTPPCRYFAVGFAFASFPSFASDRTLSSSTPSGGLRSRSV
jgi:hypothetical protein